MRYLEGQTGLVVPVPAADALVGPWRDELDPAAAYGVGPHITVLYPFLTTTDIGAPELAALTTLAAGHPAFDLEFQGCGRFPGVLYLAPEPEAPLRALTAAVWARWPQTPPYGGQFGDPIPHLTVADGATDPDSRRAESDLTAGLPLRCRVDRLDLVAFDGRRWAPAASFPLGPVS